MMYIPHLNYCVCRLSTDCRNNISAAFIANETRSIDSLVRQEIRYAKTVNRIYSLKRFTFLFVCTLSQANKK